MITAIREPEIPAQPVPPPRVAELLATLSLALDMSGGQPKGHALRTCLIGLKMAEEIGLDDAHMSGLYYGLLVKDAGCAGSASDIYHFFGADEIDAQRASRLVDWHDAFEVAKYAAVAAPNQSLLNRARNVLFYSRHRENAGETLIRVRADAAKRIVRKLDLGHAAEECVCALDERWDGSGGPGQLSQFGIPLMARIASVAQAIDILSSAYDRKTAFEIVAKRSGTAYDPATVAVALSLQYDAAFWQLLEKRPLATLLSLDLSVNRQSADDERIGAICEAYAAVVDGKSRYTLSHSLRVRQYAMEIGGTLGLPMRALKTLGHAALLHDVGKLSVPNTILEKRDTLSASEWERVRKYPAHTHSILKRISGFERLTEIACTHNERLNGSGYFQGLSAEHLDREMRIIAVADVFDALSTDRPQRQAMPLKSIFGILDEQAGEALDRDAIETVKHLCRRSSLAERIGQPTAPLRKAA